MLQSLIGKLCSVECLHNLPVKHQHYRPLLAGNEGLKHILTQEP
jgi:hypothetical protein